MNLNLLIIEDDDAIIKDWIQKLSLYAVETNPIYTIIPKYVKNIVKANELLSNGVFDAAIIDIRLESADSTLNSDGNDLFTQISSSTLTVSAVCTGEPSSVNIADHPQDFVKVFEKGDGVIADILKWLDLKVSMISAIQNMQTVMNSKMAEAFTQSIWPRWNHWLHNDEDAAATEQALIRHMATHLHASFLNQTSAAHPEEYFFIPPLQERLDTGDVFLIEDVCYILVTPRCDLALEKNISFQLVELKSVKEDWDRFQAAYETTSNKSNRAKIRNIIDHGGKSPKLHFIPQIRQINEAALGPFHAQFGHMKCMGVSSEEKIELVSKRIATLSNEFVPSLVERLGAYFSRIGTPDYSHPE